MKKTVFVMEKTVFITKKIVFDTKKIVFATKKIYFDKKRMKTAISNVFPGIETIAFTIWAIVFLVEITIGGTKMYSQKRNPFSAHLRSVSLLRRRPALSGAALQFQPAHVNPGQRIHNQIKTCFRACLQQLSIIYCSQYFL
jgi:hypothetical protein